MTIRNDLTEPGLLSSACATSATSEAERVLYVVTGAPKRMTNDRVAGVLKLRPHFRRVVLVTRGTERGDEENLVVRPIPNPFAWLRRVGLYRWRRSLERLIFFPNAQVLFTAVAKRRLEAEIAKDIRAGRAVTLLVCVPNHENTSVGLHLKKRFPAVLWVMDWQDLWTYDENYFERVLPAYRGRLRERERRIFAAADVHVTTNEYAATVLNHEYGVPRERIRAIHHHFDSDSLLPCPYALAPFPEDGSIRVGFLGSLFKPPRVPGLRLMNVIRELRLKRGLDVRIHLHGRLPKDMQRKKALLEESGLVLEQPVPHRRCAAVLSRYDYLLVLLADLPNSKAVMSIKLPQYLIAGRPILALVPEHSAVGEIVTRSRTGVVVPSGGDWYEGLVSALNVAKVRSANDAVVEEFSWSRLSERWLEVLTPCRDTQTQGHADGAPNTVRCKGCHSLARNI